MSKIKALTDLLQKDVAGSLTEVANSFDTLTVGLTGFSEAANNANDNYQALLDGLTKVGSAFGEIDAAVTALFGGTSKLGGALTGVLKPLRLISQSAASFAQVQRIFGEVTGALDALSAGVRQNYSEFHALTNSFGGTYAEAQKLSVLFTDIQQKSGSQEFGWVSRKELLDTAKAMESSNIQISRMSEIIPAAGKNMDFLTTAVLQADAVSMSITEHMGFMSSAIMKTGLSSEEAFKQIAGFKVHPTNKDKIPACTYCDPEVASIGLTEKEADKKGFEFKVGIFPFSANGKALAMGYEEGFIKTIIDKNTGEFLGVHMVGMGVTELIHNYALAKEAEIIQENIENTIFPHPTLSEAIHESVLKASGREIHI